MARPATVDSHVRVEEQSESDYGSDFSPEEQEIVDKLLATGPAQIEAVEDNPITNSVEYHESSPTLRVPRVLGREIGTKETHVPLEFVTSRAGSGLREQSNPKVAESSYPVEVTNREEPEDGLLDTRSPLERFRSAPRKPLSVTDLVSPSWCELQYWYMLKIHGRKKATQAMKGGTVVHQRLEAEIYTTVKVYPQSKEDAWGLKIWNVIQGLKTLKEIGHTRELQVWGTIDGLLVNGVIDEISFTCPDTELEAKTDLKENTSKDELPSDQMTISDFFKASDGQSFAPATRARRRSQSTKAYLCDVKTRSVASLPTGAAFRPTRMQLMLYHRLLGNLATNNVDFSIILERFGLDGNVPLSDAFIAQIGNLNDSAVFSGSPDIERSQESMGSASQDSMSILLEHNSLNALWALMMTHFQGVLPDGRASIGNILKAEYRSRQTGEVVGVTTFPMDERLLSAYVEREMQWWKGDRKPEGVVIEEAYKCQTCEYANICEWRLARAEEATEKSRQRKKLMGPIRRSEV